MNDDSKKKKKESVYWIKNVYVHEFSFSFFPCANIYLANSTSRLSSSFIRSLHSFSDQPFYIVHTISRASRHTRREKEREREKRREERIIIV